WRADKEWLWDCTGGKESPDTPVVIAGGDDLTATLQVRADELFDLGLTDGVTGPAFDPIAGADSDADGVGTRAELMQAPAPSPKGDLLKTVWAYLQYYGVSRAFPGFMLSTGDMLACNGSFGRVEHKGLPGM